MESSAEKPTLDHVTILEQNVRLHRTEAHFYNATHPENYNLFEQRRLKRQVRTLAAQIEPSRGVLDLASGTGNVADHLRRAGINTIACDLSRDMLRENRSQHRVQCDITRLPFKDGCFAAVTAYSVFHHLPDPGRTTREVCRVAAENCVLYFDHDHFLPQSHKTLGHYPFTATDLAGWLAWLVLHPKYVKRLFQYALWGRQRHLRNMGQLDQAESHDRVRAEELAGILETEGFHVQLVSYGRGSFLWAGRKRQSIVEGICT